MPQNLKKVVATVENSMTVPQKKKMHTELSKDPASPYLRIYPKEIESRPLNRYLNTRVQTYSQWSKGHSQLKSVPTD